MLTTANNQGLSVLFSPFFCSAGVWVYDILCVGWVTNGFVCPEGAYKKPHANQIMQQKFASNTTF
jgi:hypothetical protein